MSDQFDYVYIEDDLYLRKAWEMVAKKKGIRLLTLSSTMEFEKHIGAVNKDTTKIYIDSGLGPTDMKGEDFAKLLHDQGYKNLFIATGYEPSKFANLPWLKYSGKDCPFGD